MFFKILKKDFFRKKIITLTLFIFIVLSALLVASGANMIVELFSSLNNLFVRSKAPHYVQMHVGEINQAVIDNWSLNNNLVQKQQTVEIINIEGSNIYLSDDNTSQKNSVVDFYFTKQNLSFDLLLNLESEVIKVSKGEIAVPIYFMQRENIKLGDKVKISNQQFEMEFTVVDFVRDVQMNSAIVHSKRFVVNKDDFKTLKENTGEIEYMIEYQLTDLNNLSEFTNSYQASPLPDKGPAVDYNLFKVLNSISDGIVIVVVIIISILLNIIALFCIRFAILMNIEEDYREIGVMKAIGISQWDIKKMYLSKYLVMAALASVIGYLMSLLFKQLFTANILLYIGTAPKSSFQNMIPLFAVVLIFLMIIFSCMLVLRRFNKMGAVEALRAGNMGEREKNNNHLSLKKSKLLNVNVFLGIKDVFQRLKMFRLVFFVFFVCSFVVIVPVNFLNTIQSSSFITYLGIGRSDIRIDLQQSDNVVDRYNNMIAYIKEDEDVDKFSPMLTCQYKVVNSDGVEENINVEIADFNVLPLKYLKGGAPLRENEIALSYLNAEELDKSVGDTLVLMVDGQEREVLVSGIYQDITNGGRTAKAVLPQNYENALWYVLSLDINDGINIKEKVSEYENKFYPAKVTHLEEYLNQTLGNTINQIKQFTIIAVVVALSISILITSLFLRMLVAKDYSEIAIMKSIGFSLKDIRIQYVIKTLFVLIMGIISGTIVSNTVGQKLVSFLWSFLGASQIEFIIDLFQSYILVPLILIVVVTITTLISIMSVKEARITEMIVE